jgi:hypothetical protein
MTGHPSSPLVAAIGLVATAADGLRRLPRVLGSAGHVAARRYDELAARGQDVLAGRPRAGSGERALADLLEKAEQRTQPAPAGPPSPAGIAEATAPGAGSERAVPPIGRTEPVVLPEDVQEEVAQRPSGAELTHDQLPLADFDHQTVPQLRGRLRTLDLAQLVQLRDYEQAHGARLPVLTLLDNRIAKLLAETGPTGQ